MFVGAAVNPLSTVVRATKLLYYDRADQARDPKPDFGFARGYPIQPAARSWRSGAVDSTRAGITWRAVAWREQSNARGSQAILSHLVGVDR